MTNRGITTKKPAHRLGHTLHLTLQALLLLLMAVACGTAPASPSGAGGKADDLGDGVAQCNDIEFEIFSLCISEGCPGLVGSALEICLQETCGEDLEEVGASCSTCVIESMNDFDADFDQVTEICFTPQWACTDEDMEALSLCRSEACADSLHLETCMQESCGDELADIEASCTLCFLSHGDESIEDVQSICAASAASDGTETCSIDDLHMCDDSIVATGDAGDCPILEDQAALSECCVSSVLFDTIASFETPICSFIDQPSLASCEIFKEAVGQEEWQDCTAVVGLACDLSIWQTDFLSVCCDLHNEALQCF